ncbi:MULTISPECIES: hypothetical protein [Streptomyces violaceusniger group]|uniref:hypothetical protein n=1 Tax=Streptomyces violaceusniger group TaxID=2839105 RepID=UPI000A371710|nr:MULTISPECIES: hypothetical protein [Streptomyces violaceusniger group]
MLRTPTLIAVIGPVEPPLLTAWIGHYRWLGIERFLIAFHFPSHAPAPLRRELHGICREMGILPAGTSSGPWHEHLTTRIRDALRHQAGDGWHLLAGVEEFQQYPAPLGEVIAQAERSRRAVVGGLLLDRLSASGRFTGWSPSGGLDLAYPLGGHLTHRLLHGDPRKIVLARHDIPLSPHSHHAMGYQPDPDRLCAVHHFRWRAGLLEDLRNHNHLFTADPGQEHRTAHGDEVSRLFTHLGRHGGVVNVTDPRLAFRRASLDRMPHSWPGEARGIHTAWRPPRAARPHDRH